jgi:hypothetical protein
MFAIRARRKVASERDFLDAVDKVVRQGTKFSSTYVLFYPDDLTLIFAPLALCIKYITSPIMYVCCILLRLCIEYLTSNLGKTFIGTQGRE